MVLKGTPQRCGSTIVAPGAISAVGDWHLPEDSREHSFSGYGERRLVHERTKPGTDPGGRIAGPDFGDGAYRRSVAAGRRRGDLFSAH